MQVNGDWDTDPGLRRRASPHSEEEEGLKEEDRQEDGKYKAKVQGCIIHLQYCIPQQFIPTFMPEWHIHAIMQGGYEQEK